MLIILALYRFLYSIFQMVKTTQTSAFAKFKFLKIFLNFLNGRWTETFEIYTGVRLGSKNVTLGWTDRHYIRHGGQTREFFKKKATLSDSDRINSVQDGENRTKIGPRNVGKFVHAPGLVTKELMTHARSCARRSTHNSACCYGRGYGSLMKSAVWRGIHWRLTYTGVACC